MRSVRESLFRLSASTRIRNRDVARQIRSILAQEDRVLDAGCGEFGLAPFLPDARVVGVDITQSRGTGQNFQFQVGSIMALPFADRSFAVAASVDTIEHLPARLRVQALMELVRVATKAVVVSFPGGENARKLDEHFHRQLIARKMAEPEWLREHLSDAYPDEASTKAALEAAADAVGRKVEVTSSYSEWDTIARLVRAGYARSGRLGLIADLLLGYFAPLLAQPSRSRSYRAILVARFS